MKLMEFSHSDYANANIQIPWLAPVLTGSTFVCTTLFHVLLVANIWWYDRTGTTRLPLKPR